MDKPVKSYTVEEARRRLERYCAYQERCHQEVVRKLRGMRMIPAAIDDIVVHLINHDFLNESRFAAAFARSKFHQKKWGRQRIRRELEQRGISGFNLNAAMKKLDDTEYEETLHQLALKRLGQLKENHPLKRKRKLADYLLYRGWEKELVYQKVHELLD